MAALYCLCPPIMPELDCLISLEAYARGLSDWAIKAGDQW